MESFGKKYLEGLYVYLCSLHGKTLGSFFHTVGIGPPLINLRLHMPLNSTMKIIMIQTNILNTTGLS